MVVLTGTMLDPQVIYMNMYIIIITGLAISGWCFPMGFYEAKLLSQMPFLTHLLLVAFYDTHDVMLVLFLHQEPYSICICTCLSISENF